MNISFFGKTIKNVKKHRNIKLVATGKRRNRLVSEPNYHTTKWFWGNLLSIEMKKIKVKMKKAVYLGLPILKISKTLLYEFWYDYINPKYQDNAKLKMFMKILLMTLKKDSIHQIMMLIDHCLQEKKRKSYWIDEKLIRRKGYDRICCN